MKTRRSHLILGLMLGLLAVFVVMTEPTGALCPDMTSAIRAWQASSIGAGEPMTSTDYILFNSFLSGMSQYMTSHDFINYPNSSPAFGPSDGCVPVAGADFAFAPDKIQVGTAWVFTASVSSGLAPITYTWSFGDGVVQTGMAVTVRHVFTTSDDHLVQVTAANYCGQSIAIHRVQRLGPNGHIQLDHSNASFPRLVAQNNHYYLLWVEDRDGEYDLYFTDRSFLGDWLPAERVNVLGNTLAPNSRPALAVDTRDTVHIAWVDTRNNAFDLYYSSRPSGGSSWSTPVKVNDGTGQVWSPALVADQAGNLYAAWRDSRDSGSPDDPTQNQTFVYASKRSVVGGWGPNVRVNNSDVPEDRASPALALHGDTLHFAWADFREGNSDIYYERITTSDPIWSRGGAYNTFNKRVNPDDDGIDQVDPAIVVDSAGNVYVAWADNKDASGNNRNSNIYISMLPANQSNWTGVVPRRLNDDNTAQPQGLPSLSADGLGNVFAAWMDGRDRADAPYYWSIYSTELRERQGQLVWDANSRVSDGVASPSREWPVVATTADGDAYVIWRDFRDGPPHLYFADLSHSVAYRNYLPLITNGR